MEFNSLEILKEIKGLSNYLDRMQLRVSKLKNKTERFIYAEIENRLQKLYKNKDIPYFWFSGTAAVLNSNFWLKQFNRRHKLSIFIGKKLEVNLFVKSYTGEFSKFVYEGAILYVEKGYQDKIGIVEYSLNDINILGNIVKKYNNYREDEYVKC